MISVNDFFSSLEKMKINYFTGIPDSLLKFFCSYLLDNPNKLTNIITANEGAAIGLASGYHLASGKIPVVYMQNSGLGNAINPLLSLADPEVYSIPILLIIGWRGEPGQKDEPQHIKQGKVTTNLLKSLDIPYDILPTDFQKAEKSILNIIGKIKESSRPMAILVRKKTFAPYEPKNIVEETGVLLREQAIEVIVDHLDKTDIIVSTTGKTSRELFEYRNKRGHGHKNDFLTVGSMGHANQIALGIALEKPNCQVFCIDGDGALLMHTGSLGIIGNNKPSNFKHILINNGAHESVGGQPTIGFSSNFIEIAKAFNYKNTLFANSEIELIEKVNEIKKIKGPAFLEIRVKKGARKDLGRPTVSPIDNKISFMNYLKSL